MNISSLYDEWRRRYAPPHLDPHSDQFVVPNRPKPVYRSVYPNGREPSLDGKTILFGLIAFFLLHPLVGRGRIFLAGELLLLRPSLHCLLRYW